MPSMDLAGFIAHLAGVAAELEERSEAQREALERAAHIVEQEAKAEIGHYQSSAGPYAAWPELAEATQEDRERRGYNPNDPGLRSGEMRDNIGHAVGDGEAVVGSNDDKLVYFELGTETQPPRSVLGMAAVHKEQEVAELLGKGVVASIMGRGI